MREFTTAVKAATEIPEEVEAGTPFSIDGHECRYFKPGDGQLAVVMAAVGRHTSVQGKIAGIINFFASVLDDSSNVYVVDRLLDRKDPFGLEEVQDIMEAMIEDWSGKVTPPPPASAPLPQPDGVKSTQPTPALI